MRPASLRCMQKNSEWVNFNKFKKNIDIETLCVYNIKVVKSTMECSSVG